MSALRPFLKRHVRSLGSGAMLGALVAAGLSVHPGPLLSEAHPDTPVSANGDRAFHQPRFDELLRLGRQDGRLDRAAWQNLRETTQAWLLADPMECLNHLGEMGATALLDDTFLDEALMKAAHGQFSVALKLADSIGNAALRTRWITRAFEMETERDPESALLALNSVPATLQFTLGEHLAKSWAAKDPLKAIQGAMTHNPKLIRTITLTWAEHDPDAAFRFYATANRRIEYQPGVSYSAQEVIAFGTGLHPQRALKLVRDLPQNARTADITRGALHVIAESDPREAVQLAVALRGDLERFDALSSIADTASQSDPALGAEIRDLLPGNQARATAEADALLRTEHEHPAQLALQAEALSNPIARSDAMHSAAESWMRQQPETMLEFATQPGNSTWMRVLVDNVLDHAEAQNYGAQISPELLGKLSPEARACVLAEIATRPASQGRDGLLEALQ